MGRRTRRRNGGIAVQRAPMNLRLLTTRYGASSQPLNLNASAHHPRRENWDDWVAVDDRRDIGTLVSALKTWFPSLDNAFSDSEWEDLESLSNKRASVEESRHANSSKERGKEWVKGKGKGKGKARASEDEGERRPSTSSLQSVLEEDESSMSGADADVSAEGSSHLHSSSTLSTSSLSLNGSGKERWQSSSSDYERSPGASYLTPRSYPTMSFSTERTERTTQASFSSPNASFATPRPPLTSFSTDRVYTRPSFGSQSTEKARERPSIEILRPALAAPSTPTRQLSFTTEDSIEFTPIGRPLTLSPSYSRSLAPSPYSDYGEHPNSSPQRSLNTAASFSTQRSTASANNASMGLALRLQQVSAVPTLTTLPSPSANTFQRPAKPDMPSSPASCPIIPPIETLAADPDIYIFQRSLTRNPPSSPDTAPGSASHHVSYLGYATSSHSPLLPSHAPPTGLGALRRSGSFAHLDKRHSLPSKTQLHDLDTQSLQHSRSLLSLPSVPSVAGVGLFLNDMDAISLGGTHEGTHEGTYDGQTRIPVSSDGYGAGRREAGSHGSVITWPHTPLSATPKTKVPAPVLAKSGSAPRTLAEEYAAPVAQRPAHFLDSTGQTVGRVARTLRSIQSLGALRPAASLQSLRAKFAKRPSDSAPRPRLTSKEKKRAVLPSLSDRPLPSTPSSYRGGVPGSPAPRRSSLMPREGIESSSLRYNKTPAQDPRSKPPKPSTRLRLRRPKSYLLRYDVATTEAEESERQLLERIELHGRRRKSRLKALNLHGML